MVFCDRKNAGEQLAEKVNAFLSTLPAVERKKDVLVVGLPRGGVPVALEVARRLGCPLDIIVAKKLAFPGQPEFAIGAVTADGIVVLSPDIPKEPKWNAYIENEKQVLFKQTQKVEQKFYDLAGGGKYSFQGKTIIVVDDGIATGMTVMAALESARKRGASRIILAAPVMSADSYMQLGRRCDRIIALNIPEEFRAVGLHYQDFSQTADEEVISALREARQFSRQPEALPKDANPNTFDLPAL